MSKYRLLTCIFENVKDTFFVSECECGTHTNELKMYTKLEIEWILEASFVDLRRWLFRVFL